MVNMDSTSADHCYHRYMLQELLNKKYPSLVLLNAQILLPMSILQNMLVKSGIWLYVTSVQEKVRSGTIDIVQHNRHCPTDQYKQAKLMNTIVNRLSDVSTIIHWDKNL